MLALVPLVVIIKVSGHYQQESERQEGQEKKRLAEYQGRHRVGAGEKVKRGQIPLTPVPGAA